MIVVTPNSYYQWIPSNIWVGVGRMSVDQVRFKLAPLYKRWGIDYRQAKALSIHPEGETDSAKPFVTIEYTSEDKRGQLEKYPTITLSMPRVPSSTSKPPKALGQAKTLFRCVPTTMQPMPGPGFRKLS